MEASLPPPLAMGCERLWFRICRGMTSPQPRRAYRYYDLVMAAQAAAIEAMRDGQITASQLDHVARSMIAEAGYGPPRPVVLTARDRAAVRKSCRAASVIRASSILMTARS